MNRRNNGISIKGSAASQFVGYFLVMFMIITVGIMLFSIYSSWNAPKAPIYTPPAVISPEISSSASDSSPSPDASPSPQPSAKPSSQPSGKPSPLPYPSVSPSKKPDEKIVFKGAAPDGPPNYEPGDDIYDGKSGASYINLRIKPKIWDGTIVYLIDKAAGEYFVLRAGTVDKGLYQAKIPPGKYVLRITRPGYVSFSTPVSLKDGFVAEIIDPLEIRPYFAINTIPPGADVYFNNQKAGTTPVSIKNLETKRYEIKIAKPGYETIRLNLKFSAGKGIEKKINLNKI